MTLRTLVLEGVHTHDLFMYNLSFIAHTLIVPLKHEPCSGYFLIGPGCCVSLNQQRHVWTLCRKGLGGLHVRREVPQSTGQRGRPWGSVSPGVGPSGAGRQRATGPPPRVCSVWTCRFSAPRAPCLTPEASVLVSAVCGNLAEPYQDRHLGPELECPDEGALSLALGASTFYAFWSKGVGA